MSNEIKKNTRIHELYFNMSIFLLAQMKAGRSILLTNERSTFVLQSHDVITDLAIRLLIG